MFRNWVKQKYFAKASQSSLCSGRVAWGCARKRSTKLTHLPANTFTSVLHVFAPGTNDRELGKHILLGVTNGQPLQSGSTAASGPSCSPEEVHHVREYQRLAPQPCQMVNAIRLRLRTNNTVDRETVPSLFVCSEAACRRPKIERANSKTNLNVSIPTSVNKRCDHGGARHMARICGMAPSILPAFSESELLFQ